MSILVYEQLLQGTAGKRKKEYQKIETADLTYLPFNFGLASPSVTCDSHVGVVMNSKLNVLIRSTMRRNTLSLTNSKHLLLRVVMHVPVTTEQY